MLMKESQNLLQTKSIFHPCYPNNIYKFDNSFYWTKGCLGCDIKGSENITLENYRIFGRFDEQQCKTLLTKIMYNYAGGASADVSPENNWDKLWRGLIGGNKNNVTLIY